MIDTNVKLKTFIGQNEECLPDTLIGAILEGSIGEMTVLELLGLEKFPEDFSLITKVALSHDINELKQFVIWAVDKPVWGEHAEGVTPAQSVVNLKAVYGNVAGGV